MANLILEKFALEQAQTAQRSIEIPVSPGTVIATVLLSLAIYSRKRLAEIAKHVAKRFWDIVSDRLISKFDNELAYRLLARNYCRSVLADDTKSSIRVPPSRRSLPVAAIYVNLTLRSSHGADVEGTPSVRIVGEPGSGKSTYLRYQLVRGCDKLLRPFGQRQSRLPVFVELARSGAFRSSEPGECADALMAELEGMVDRRSRPSERGIFAHFSTGRGVLVLLDGLDEVKQDRIHTAAEAISIVMGRLRECGINNRVLLTMREQCYRLTDDALDNQFPVTGRFDALTGNDIFQYLCKWPWSPQTSLARGEQEHGLGYESKLPLHSVQIANNVFRLLETQPTLRGLCGNPLILAMYIATVEDDGTPVSASNKTEFFRIVADELLYDRRARPRGDDEDRRLRLRSLRESIGMAAAGHIEATEEGYNQIPKQRMLDALALHFADPDEALLEIERDTGLIRYQGDEFVAFIHGSFLDYFAARWYANHEQEPWLRPARLERRLERKDLASGRLEGVVAHGCSLAPRAGQDRALSYIAEYLPAFMGLALIETRRYDHNSLSGYLDSEVGLLSNVELETYPEIRGRFGNLVHILTDLNMNRTYFPTVTVDPSDYAQACVANASVDQDELFRTILQSDSSLALAFASLLGADLSEFLPELYVDSCDDWYIASALIENLRDIEDGAYETKNCILLAEASLRYPSVSFLLDTIHMPRDTDWGRHLLKRHKRQTYEASGFQRSLLTVVLQRAVCAPPEALGSLASAADLSRLSAVRDAPKPNDWWFGHRSGRILHLLSALLLPTLAFVALLSSTFNLTDGKGGLSGSGTFILIGTALIAAALAIWGTMVQTRIKLFRIIHRPFLDLDYLRPFGHRSWASRWTYLVTRVRFKKLAGLVVLLRREPFGSLFRYRNMRENVANSLPGVLRSSP